MASHTSAVIKKIIQISIDQHFNLTFNNLITYKNTQNYKMSRKLST